MYGFLWRKLPGGFVGKLAGCVVLAVGALALLFFVLFPWVEPRLPWNDVTVNSPTVEQNQPSAPPSASPSAPASVLPAG